MADDYLEGKRIKIGETKLNARKPSTIIVTSM
jgi:hypothetical protein